jgi:hypothetical protein
MPRNTSTDARAHYCSALHMAQVVGLEIWTHVKPSQSRPGRLARESRRTVSSSGPVPTAVRDYPCLSDSAQLRGSEIHLFRGWLCEHIALSYRGSEQLASLRKFKLPATCVSRKQVQFTRGICQPADYRVGPWSGQETACEQIRFRSAEGASA